MNNQPVAVATEAGQYSFYAENLGQCLKSTYQFTGILYQNICSGTQYFVPNGFWDYTAVFVMAFIGLGIALMLLAIIVNIILE